jgi:cell division protein FtsW
MTLLTIGIVMMFSASYVSAKYSSATGHDAFFYLKRQVRSAIIGIVLMLIVANIDYRFYKKALDSLYNSCRLCAAVNLCAYQSNDY